MRPRYWVTEKVDERLEEAHQRRARARRTLGKASHRVHVGSRTFALGALRSAALGVLASIPLIARTLFPRLTARLRKVRGQMILDPPTTQLQLERGSVDPGPENGQVGLTLAEMTDIADRVL